MTHSAADVIVVGGGVAGSAAAIMLAKFGCRVVIVARPEPRRWSAGESLSPAARGPLRALDMWGAFLASNPLPCHLNRSVWGDSEPRAYDFIRDPRGHGWHVDHHRFQQLLAARACALADRIFVSQLNLVERDGVGWRLDLAPGTIKGDYLIDATGRGSWLARRCGARRIATDRQLALVGTFHCGATASDTSTLVESVVDGWWYSAEMPGDRLALAFMTDADLRPAIPRRRADWIGLLARAPATRRRFLSCAAAEAHVPRLVSANGARLDRMSGAGWLAGGDAAISYDPISAHGLTVALASGRDAAIAIAAALEGDDSALPHYAHRLERAFVAYQALRADTYKAEGRWPLSPYWRRRGTDRKASAIAVPRPQP